jgi:hypothetical protein
MTSAIDPNFITTDPVSKSGMRTQLQAAANEITALQASTATLSSDKFDKAGGTLTGDVTISKNSPSIALRRSAAGQATPIWSYVTTTARWLLNFGTADTESGSNAGSNVQLSRYSDAGAFIETVLTIARSTGIFAFTQTPTAPTAAVANNSTKLATTAFVQNEMDQQIRRGSGSTVNGVGSVTISPGFSTSLDSVQLTVKNGGGAISSGTAVPIFVGAGATGSSFNVYGDVTQSLTFYWVAVGR